MSQNGNHNLLGAAALSLGILVFSIQDALIKALSNGYAVTEVVFVRAVVAFPLLLAFVSVDSGIASIRSQQFGPLVLRGVLLLIAYTTFYMAFPALPLATAIALFFTVPLFVTLLAAVFLREQIGAKAVFAVLLGFGGVLVMTNPFGGLFEPAVLLSLASAFFYAVSAVLARKLGVSVSTSVLAFHQNWVYLVGAGLIAALLHALGVAEAPHPSLAFLVRPWNIPPLRELAMMAACGVIAAIAMSLLAHAYRMAEANVVTVFEYTGMIWSPLWGFLLWQEVPAWPVIIGAAMIASAGVLALYRPSG